MATDRTSAHIRGGADPPDRDHRPGGGESPPHDAVGAYVLDALPADERRAFEDHLPTCADCSRAVTELSPVVALLSRRYDREPPAAKDAPPPTPSADLRDRIVASARIRGQDSEVRSPSDVATSPGPTAPRARGVVPLRPEQWIGAGWAAAAVLAVIAAAAIIWALSLQLRLDERQGELAAQQATIAEQAAELEQLRQRGEATAFALAPTADGPSDAVGSLLYAPRDQFGVLYVRGLSPLPEERVYQLWYIRDGTPQPGGTFAVGEDGVGSLALTGEVPAAQAVALTVEPAGGSPAPTTAPLLAGDVELAAG